MRVEFYNRIGGELIHGTDKSDVGAFITLLKTVNEVTIKTGQHNIEYKGTVNEVIYDINFDDEHDHPMEIVKVYLSDRKDQPQIDKL